MADQEGGEMAYQTCAYCGEEMSEWKYSSERTKRKWICKECYEAFMEDAYEERMRGKNDDNKKD